MDSELTYTRWLVVSNTFYFHPENWGRFPFLLIFSREGVVETTNQIQVFIFFFFRQDDQIYELEAAELGYSLLHGFLVLGKVGGCYGMLGLGGWCWDDKSSNIIKTIQLG